jgi:hypothetical protein
VFYVEHLINDHAGLVRFVAPLVDKEGKFVVDKMVFGR